MAIGLIDTPTARKLRRARNSCTLLLATAMISMVLALGQLERHGWYAAGSALCSGALVVLTATRRRKITHAAEKLVEIDRVSNQWSFVTLDSSEPQVMATLGQPRLATQTIDGERMCEWQYPSIGPDVVGRCRFEGTRVTAVELPRMPTDEQLLRA